MASRISQMRNGQAPAQVPAQQQQQLNESIERTRSMMNQIKNASDPQAAFAQMLESNPMISNLLQNRNLERIARQMASSNGIDIIQLIKQLQ